MEKRSIILKSDPIFIADSHYNKKNKTLLELLKQIESKKIKCNQLFLMGDIFDFLSGEISYFKNINSSAIDLINTISYSIEVIYLEGNHDYNLKKVFPNSLVIPRESQPFKISYDSQNIMLSHGDIFTPVGYNIYCSIIRNSFLLKFLNMIDINFWLSYKIEQSLLKKDICIKNESFKNNLHKRFENYDCDLVIEGHFHQGILTKNYINIPSLFCDKKYMIFQNNQFKFNMVQ